MDNNGLRVGRASSRAEFVPNSSDERDGADCRYLAAAATKFLKKLNFGVRLFPLIWHDIAVPSFSRHRNLYRPRLGKASRFSTSLLWCTMPLFFYGPRCPQPQRRRSWLAFSYLIGAAAFLVPVISPR